MPRTRAGKRSAAAVEPLTTTRECLLDDAHALAPRPGVRADAVEVTHLRDNSRQCRAQLLRDSHRPRQSRNDVAVWMAYVPIHREAYPSRYRVVRQSSASDPPPPHSVDTSSSSKLLAARADGCYQDKS